jgi:hypothetical protein
MVNEVAGPSLLFIHPRGVEVNRKESSEFLCCTVGLVDLWLQRSNKKK